MFTCIQSNLSKLRPVTLALIIEASLESYFLFWLQSNYSLTNTLALAAEFKHIAQLTNLFSRQTFSILLSFITIIYSIIKIRFELN